MFKIGVLAAASALALSACSDVVDFPGAGDVPTPGGSEAPAPETPPTTDTPTDPVSDPVTDPVQPDPAPVEPPATDPAPTGDPTTDETGTTDTGETDPDATDTDSSAETETGDPSTGETDVADTDTSNGEGGDDGEITPTPVALGIDNLLEVNAEICAASDSPTLTVAEVAGAGEPEATFGTAVVNGTAVDRGNFPGIVKLEPRRRIPNTTRTSSGHCAATRISEQWFVTAAHCLDSDYDVVTIVAGVNRLSDPNARRITAQTTICHSAYGGSAEEYANDIALVKMPPDALNVLADVPIARFGRTEKLLGATNYPTVDMAGWGLTGFNDHLSNELLTAQLRTNNVGPAIISIASQNGAGPCVGDSGGPLYVTEDDGEKTLVGVLSVVENNLSTGEFCSGDYNGRYTNLQGFLPWVEAVINTCDAEGGDALCIDG